MKILLFSQITGFSWGFIMFGIVILVIKEEKVSSFSCPRQNGKIPRAEGVVSENRVCLRTINHPQPLLLRVH